MQQPAQYQALPTQIREPRAFGLGALPFDKWTAETLLFAKRSFGADAGNAEPAASFLGTFRKDLSLQFHLICSVNGSYGSGMIGIAVNLQSPTAYASDIAPLSALITSFSPEQRTLVLSRQAIGGDALSQRQLEILNMVLSQAKRGDVRPHRLSLDFRFKAYVRTGKSFHETMFARA